MDPSPEDFNKAIREILSHKQERTGWKRSRLDAQQREYIIERERITEAFKALQCVSWQSINCHDRDLAEQIRANALHSMAVLHRAMVKNEENLL